MPPQARSLREHIGEGSFRPRYARLLAAEPLDEAPPDAYANLSSRVGPLWATLVRLQDAYVAAPHSRAAEALGVDVYRTQVVREFTRAAKELHEIIGVLLQHAGR